MRSAPASSTASTSAPRRAKSADRIEGAIHAADMGNSLRGEPRQCLAILGAAARYHFRRQSGPRRTLVPVERLEIIAHELLVEARRTRAGTVSVGRPEARGIRGQHLVD